jgi:hypothetical protein
MFCCHSVVTIYKILILLLGDFSFLVVFATFFFGIFCMFHAVSTYVYMITTKNI